MALDGSAIKILGRLRREGYLHGSLSVLEIGAQQLSNDFLASPAELAALGDLFGASGPCPLPGIVPTHLAHGMLEHLAEGAPPARDFWGWLGFDYAAIDIDGSPGSIPLDLNYDPAPEDALGRYLLVTNFGTTEHLANQLNAFKVVHDVTAVGGVMMHSLPMQGMLNHGLVNYNPKFFWMLARSNGYRVVYMNVISAQRIRWWWPFVLHQVRYGFPDNIAAAISPFEPDIDDRRAGFRVADMNLIAVLQKVFDTPYVAPIDVPTGARVDDSRLKERYWSVFKPNAFENLAESVPPQPGKAEAG